MDKNKNNWEHMVKQAYEDLTIDNISDPTKDDIKYIREACKEALKCKNSGTQVGNVLVKDDKIIGSSHPVLIDGFDYEDFPKDGNSRYMQKYDFIWYAEMMVCHNARKNGNSVEGSILYKTYGCPPDTFKYLILEGVKEFVFSLKKDECVHSDNMVSNSIMAKKYGVNIRLIRLLTDEELDGVERPKNYN